MTRISICSAHTLEKLELGVNAEMERLEADGYGVKALVEVQAPERYALAIVYGNGPTTTQRWSGSHG